MQREDFPADVIEAHLGIGETTRLTHDCGLMGISMSILSERSLNLVGLTLDSSQEVSAFQVKDATLR
ncbi:hypothetical protein HPA02_10880 [Bisbaumannia pacifica]|uniref:Uncharacterized protein n=1 Tax=Bisbaumannia pacifica TaxID=77098 RepID=A0A510X8J9_9GAMM|nr:hypothetical protein HPA02_10880 [Halomonas pacifica]